MKVNGCITCVVAMACLALVSCREEIEEGPTEAEIIAELQAEKKKEEEARERKRKSSVEAKMAKLRAAESQEVAETDVPVRTEPRREERKPARQAERKPAPAPIVEDTSAAQTAMLQAQADEKAVRRTKLKEMRAAISTLQIKRDSVDERITEFMNKLSDAEEAAEVARYGDPQARIRLSGANTSSTAAADAEVTKIKTELLKLQETFEGHREAIAKQRIAYNRL